MNKKLKKRVLPEAGKKRTLRQTIIRWHYRIGLVAALFVAVLALSGITLNHTAQLNLPHRIVESEWLLDWYGLPVQAPEETAGNYPPPQLSVDKLLLDIHTGRIMGRYGPYVMDAAAVLLLIMVATGIYSWAKKPKG